MNALLSGAAALCYPSRSEGFGLPVLDAFVCETPVITSNRTSLPEVAGDAALLVDPDDPAAIAAAIDAIVRDPAVRDRLRRAGSRRRCRIFLGNGWGKPPRGSYRRGGSRLTLEECGGWSSAFARRRRRLSLFLGDRPCLWHKREGVLCSAITMSRSSSGCC